MSLSIVFLPVDVPGTGVAQVRVVGPAESGSLPSPVGFRPLRSGPIPVVVLCNGVGCPPERTHWLSVALANAGFAAVSYGLLQQIGPTTTWSPGVNLAAAGPGGDPEEPTCSVLVPLLHALSQTAELASLDLDRVVLFGHSAGGSVALTSAGRRGLGVVAGVVTYGAHLVASSMSGLPVGSVTPSRVPAVLLLGGAQDGVVQSSLDLGRYGDNTTRTDLLRLSVERGLSDASYAVAAELTNAGHFACTEGYDGLGSSGHLETDATVIDETDRNLIGALTIAFTRAVLGRESIPFSSVDALLQSSQIQIVSRH